MLSPPPLWIVRTVSPRPHRRPFSSTALALLAATACGADKSTAPQGREIPWVYGPTTGGATAEHVQGSGKKGEPVAKGWKFRLQQGRRLVLTPFQLASTHPLFGKVAVNVGLFDQADQPIGTVTSGVITAANATFTFELDEAVAAKLASLVIWYVPA